ncbi:MAG: hypothetical protein LBJ10_03710 [Clostridiales bacterium]|nr:hypothetical protein [Clostridiales bacterium]
MNAYNRALELLFRLVRGEEISVKKMADAHGVSTKSISRDLARVKAFLAENRELAGNAEVAYCNASKTHRLASDQFLCAVARECRGNGQAKRDMATTLPSSDSPVAHECRGDGQAERARRRDFAAGH